jgi:putative phosphoesterase
MQRIGLISDTHGLLRPAAAAALSGVDHIVHAGDIGSAEILVQLRRIAPVTAVRGNNDKAPWAEPLAVSAVLAFAGRRVYVLHDIGELDLDPAAAGLGVVISGHSHKPSVLTKDGVLYVNPGSAGPRRFRLPVTTGILEIEGEHLHAAIHELET